MPGTSFSFELVAGDPGVYMYHCGTKPVLMHIAMGMYGAIVVDPKRPLAHADGSTCSWRASGTRTATA
jgi:nitrite reductase (NO-forming)